MKTYVWRSGVISQGFFLSAEFGKRKEPVLVLGKAGVGSHYEALCLHRENPPKSENYKIDECDLSFIPAPREGGFYLLRESKREGVLVRVNTFSDDCSFYRDTSCEVIFGKPRRLLIGYVLEKCLHEDSIWEMQAGDVLRIRGCLTQGASQVLWVDENMQPHTACFREYLAYIASKRPIVEKEKLACAAVYNWRAGNLSRGMAIRKTNLGSVAVFGNGPFAEFLPVIDSSSAVLKNAAFVDMSGPKDQIYGLVSCNNPQENLFLLSVSTEGFKAKNSKGNIAVWKGNPQIVISSKCGEDFDESLVLMRDGDVLCIEPQGDNNMITYAVFVKDGKLVQEQGMAFKKRDLEEDVNFWAQSGWVLTENIPENWFGKIIDCYSLSYDRFLSSRYGSDCYSSNLKSRGVFQSIHDTKTILLKDCNSDKTFLCCCDLVGLPVNDLSTLKPDRISDKDSIIRLQEAEKLLSVIKDFFDSVYFSACNNELKNKIEEAVLYSAISKRPVYSLTEKKSASLSGDGSLFDYCRYLRNLISDFEKVKNSKVVIEKKPVAKQKKQIKSELTTVTPVMHSGQMAEALKKAGVI